MSLPTDLKYLNEKRCQAYLYLKSVYRPGGCSANNTKDGITELNYLFAEHLYDMLQAAKSKGYTLYITSGYRSPEAQKCANPNGFGGDYNSSMHTKGGAADLQYPDALGTSAKGCDKGSGSSAYQWVKENAKTYQISLYNDNGHRTYVNGECNHVEISGGVSGGRGPGSPASPTSPEGICMQKFSNTTDYNSCVTADRKLQDQIGTGSNTCVTYIAAGQMRRVCPNGGSNDDIRYSAGYGKNGLFGSNSSFGSMMQMMMGMQLGQGLGSTFGNLFSGSGSSNTSHAPTPTYYNPLIPPTTVPPPPVSTTPPGTSAIDNLIASLGSSSSSNTQTNTNTPVNVSASGDNVGQLQEPPAGSSPASFVSPTSGVAPLTVKAHFSSGTSCSDAYDIAWGDGSHDAMPYAPSANGTCSTVAKINDIPHTYTAAGTYAVTLKSGKALAGIRSATIIVVPVGSTIPPPSASSEGGGYGSYQSGGDIFDALASIGRIAISFGRSVFGFFTPGPPQSSEQGSQTPGTTVPLSLRFVGVDRAYLLHMPPGYDRNKRYPLMISYHGDGGTGEGQERKTGFDSIADRDGFFIVYPDSNPNYGSGKEWQLSGTNNDVDFTNTLLQAIQSAYSIDATGIYVSGFSEGGGMAQAFACASAEKIAGVANVSNNLGPAKADACHPLVPVVSVHFHGTADPISFYDGGNYKGVDTFSALETAQFWATKNGCTGSPSVEQFADKLSDGTSVTDTMREWSGCAGNSKVIFYTIDGGGHTWPGSSDEAKYGPSSQGLNASAAIWNIFSLSHR